MSPYSWRPSNYLCPHCKRRLEAKAGPDGLKAERCPNCDWSKVFDPNADEYPSDELERALLATDGGEEVGRATKHEPRYHYDREQDAHYRIDAWALAGDGSVVPKEWTEVPADQVPPNRRRDTLERDADEW